MIVLIIVASIHWRKIGIQQLTDNWNLWRATSSTSTSGIAKQIYFGICLGMLGLTGFECTSPHGRFIASLVKLTRYFRHPVVRVTHQAGEVPLGFTQPSYPGDRDEHGVDAPSISSDPHGCDPRGSECLECLGPSCTF